MVAIEHCPKSAATSSSTNANAQNNNSNNTINNTNTNNNNTSSAAVVSVLSPISISSTASASSSASATTTTTSSIQQHHHQQEQHSQEEKEDEQPQTELLSQKRITQSQSQPKKITTIKMSSFDQSSESAELAKRHKAAAATAITKSAVSQRNVDINIDKKPHVEAVAAGGAGAVATTTQELSKKVLKLDLTGHELDEFSLKSPKSPITARLTHQTSLTSSVDVEDRKTLREALYQGIFHRHRRTIFAVGSFLRMLRSRNSQYNTIRSSSEGEEVDEVVR